MKYEDRMFNFRVGDNKAYRDNWERIFGKKGAQEKGCGNCDDCDCEETSKAVRKKK